MGYSTVYRGRSLVITVARIVPFVLSLGLFLFAPTLSLAFIHLLHTTWCCRAIRLLQLKTFEHLPDVSLICLSRCDSTNRGVINMHSCDNVLSFDVASPHARARVSPRQFQAVERGYQFSSQFCAASRVPYRPCRNSPHMCSSPG